MRNELSVRIPGFFILALFMSVCLCSPAHNASAKEKKGASGSSAGTEKVKYVKSPDGVPALIEFSNSRKDMVKMLDAEEASYEKAKKAYDGAGLSRGMTMDEARKKFGEPANVDTWNKDGVTKWVYKKPSKDIASKEKVYLIFDKDGNLESWEEPR